MKSAEARGWKGRATLYQCGYYVAPALGNLLRTFVRPRTRSGKRRRRLAHRPPATPAGGALPRPGVPHQDCALPRGPRPSPRNGLSIANQWRWRGCRANGGGLSGRGEELRRGLADRVAGAATAWAAEESRRRVRRIRGRGKVSPSSSS
jgi:hypothetical protein